MYGDTRTSCGKAALVAVAVATFLMSGPAEAGCKKGFCVHGRDGPTTHVVEFTSSFTNVHHYNVSSPWQVNGNMAGRQIEIGRNVRSFVMGIGLRRPQKIEYSIQACAYGGFPPRSDCSPWVTFRHTMK